MRRRVKTKLAARVVGRMTRRQRKSATNGRRRRAAKRTLEAAGPMGGGQRSRTPSAESLAWVIYAQE